MNWKGEESCQGGEEEAKEKEEVTRRGGSVRRGKK